MVLTDVLSNPALVSTGVITCATVLYLYRKYLIPTRSYSVEIRNYEKKDNEGWIRRSWLSPNKLVSVPSDDIKTLYDVLSHSAKRIPNKRCLGTRPLIKTHYEEKEVTSPDGRVEKKKWSFMELGKHEWITYQQARELTSVVGSGLVSKEVGLGKKSKIGIYADTSAQWMLIAHGAFTQGGVVVTIYANLGEEGLLHAINDTKLTHLLSDPSMLSTILKVKKDAPSLQAVIYTTHREKPDEKILSQLEAQGVHAVSFDQLVKIGKENKTQDSPPKPDDLAVIMYTSGTTGAPKGVMMSHANLISSVSGASVAIEELNMGENDSYLGFLPLAHVLELVVENTLLYKGAGIAYGNARSLTDQLVKNCRGDITEGKPSIMAGVPVIWERIRKGALDKIKKSPWIVRTVFRVAFAYKLWMLEHGVTWTPLVDKLVFSKFREQVGGNLRGLVSGGAPLSKSTLQFLRVCFSCPALQGYGLTETSGLIALQPIHHLETDCIGAPLPCVEVKLVDVPEMGYTSKGKKQRGEIWARGANVTLGYYGNPEKTKEEFHEGGWFSTGDIAEWLPDGTLSIIDRKKNLVKLSHGEYIALERLESKFKGHELIEEICVIADSQKDLPVAVVVPNRANMEKWASQNGVDTSDWHKVCADKKSQKGVKDALNALAAQEGMKSFERLAGVYLTSDEWTVDNGMLTSAMKLKRQEIEKKYKKEISEISPQGN